MDTPQKPEGEKSEFEPVEFNMADIDPDITDKPDKWIIHNMLREGFDLCFMGTCEKLRLLTQNVFRMIVAIANNKPVFDRSTNGERVWLTYISTRGNVGKMDDMADLVHAADEMEVCLPFIDIRYLKGEERTSDGVCSIIRDISSNHGIITDLIVIDNLDWMKVPPCEIGQFICDARIAAGKNAALVFVCTGQYDDVVGYESVMGMYPSAICNASAFVVDDYVTNRHGAFEIIQDFTTM